MLVELDENDLDIIRQMVDNVYPTIDKTNNELKFCINRGYEYFEGIGKEEQSELLKTTEEQLRLLDNLKTKLGYSDDIKAEIKSEEPEIKIQ